MLSVIKSRAFKRSTWISGTVLIAYICNREFYAVWNLVLILPDVVVVLIYLFAIIESLILWIFKRKKYEKAYLPLLINISAVVIITCFLPPIYTGKMYHKGIYNLSTRLNSNCGFNLYLDNYLLASGFMATDVNAVYLTDLTNFRVYIGNYDEGDEQIDIRCYGDSIQTIKTSTENSSTSRTGPTILEKKIFSLKELLDKGHFN